MARLLSTLKDAARKYTPDKVDEVFNARPDWRYNDLNILLPHQVEDKAQGLRSIGRTKASVAISDQVLGVLADMLPNHEGGERLIDYLGHSLKPIFRHHGCPAQPCRRDGLHGLSVIIPVTNDYVIYVYPWSHASEYARARMLMTAQVEETATDRVYGNPTKITASPGDVIIFDKRLGHFGGPARSRSELQRSCDDTTWLPTYPTRPITDASWHIHLDDVRQEEPLLHGGADPVYYILPSASPADVGRDDQLDRARRQECLSRGQPPVQ